MLRNKFQIKNCPMPGRALCATRLSRWFVLFVSRGGWSFALRIYSATRLSSGFATLFFSRAWWSASRCTYTVPRAWEGASGLRPPEPGFGPLSAPCQCLLGICCHRGNTVGTNYLVIIDCFVFAFLFCVSCSKVRILALKICVTSTMTTVDVVFVVLHIW